MLRSLPYLLIILFLGVVLTNCQKTPSLPQEPEYAETENPETSTLAKKTILAWEKFVDNYDEVLCPDDFPLPVECLSECIHLTGTVNIIYHVFEDGSEGFHMLSKASNQNVKGVGLTTGTEYINAWTGVWNHHYSDVDWDNGAAKIPPCKWHITYTDRYISKGNAPNFKVTWDYHIVINAMGEMTVNRNIMDVTCY